MSGSILKETTFTPHVFSKDYLFQGIKRYAKLISILESLVDSGIMIAATNTWKEEVYNLLTEYDDDEKDDIISLLKEIDSRDRILSYPISEKYNDEDKWIVKLGELNQIRTFDFIAATKNMSFVQALESIEKEKYKNVGGKVQLQTKENVEKLLAPILSYADIVKIFDPYFKLDEKRFTDVLDIVCKNLGNMHGVKNNAIIEINTSIKIMLNNDKEFVWNLSKEWPKKIEYFEKKYKHKIVLYIWEESEKRKWHDRWIVTNQCGIYVGKGSDISNWTDSTWDLLDWNELPEIEGKFVKDRGYFTFIGKVTSLSTEKSQNPKNTSIYITPEEREKKKNTPINIKERMEKLRQSRKEAE